jgi:RimJ/RimL family protein N-acetyltransferase
MDWALAPPSIDETRSYVTYASNCWSKERADELPLLIFDRYGENLIGSTGLHRINWEIPSFEIGYWVSINHTGKGLITEAVNILTQFAFLKFNAKRIEIRCDSENDKSAAIPNRLGFVLEARLKNHRIQPISKKVSDTLVFARYDSQGLPKVEWNFHQ